MRLPRLLLVLAVLVAPASASAAERMVGPNAAVHAISDPDAQGIRYLGGDFTAWNAWDTGAFGAVDVTTGAVVTQLPRIGTTGSGDPVVYAILPDGSGGWYIGGEFDCIGGDGGRDGDCTDSGEVVRRNLARIEASGAVSGWDPSPDNTVLVLARGDGLLYVGGQFEVIDGAHRLGLVAFYSGTETLNFAWNANLDVGNHVYALAPTPEGLYVGGRFFGIGGVNDRPYLALLDGSGAATTWDPRPDNAVRSLVIDGDDLYVGGAFGTIGGVAARMVARLDRSTRTVDAAWRPNPNETVYALDLVGDTVYLGGTFDCLRFNGYPCSDSGGVPRRHLAAVDRTTAEVLSWNPSPNQAVEAIDASPTIIRVGGHFQGLASPSGAQLNRLGLAYLRADGEVLPSPAVGGAVYALTESSGRLAIGGSIGTLGGEQRIRLAALDATGQLAPWAPWANQTVKAIDVHGGTVYIAGDFSEVAGANRRQAASLSTTGAIGTWDPGVVQYGALAIAATSSTIYLGGRFEAGSGTRESLAAWDANTGALLPWSVSGIGWGTPVHALEVSNGRLLVGGEFTTLDSSPRGGLAAFDLATGALLPWDPGIDTTLSPSVRALAVAGDTLVIGGDNIVAEGRIFSGAAAFDLASAATSSASGLLSWEPTLTGAVRAVAVRGSEAFLGGTITGAEGASRGGAAAFSIDAGCLTSFASTCFGAWNPSIDGEVLAIGPAEDAMFLGGSFARVNGRSVSNLVRYGAPTSPRSPAAAARSGSAVVSWEAPVDDGTSTVTRYVATAAPGGAQCVWSSGPLECTVEGLTNGQPYTFTVRAVNALGESFASEATGAVTPSASPSPRPRATVHSMRIVRNRSIVVRVRTNGPGRIVMRGTYPSRAGTRAATPACLARRTVKRAGTFTMTCTFNARTRALLTKRSLRVTLRTTITNAAGESSATRRLVRAKRYVPVVPPVTG